MKHVLKSNITPENHPELYDYEFEKGDDVKCIKENYWTKNDGIELGGILKVKSVGSDGIRFEGKKDYVHDPKENKFIPATPAEIEAANKKFPFEYKSNLECYSYRVNEGDKQIRITNKDDSHFVLLTKEAYLEIGKRTGWSS
jgi:hypothetical protein